MCMAHPHSLRFIASHHNPPPPNPNNARRAHTMRRPPPPLSFNLIISRNITTVGSRITISSQARTLSFNNSMADHGGGAITTEKKKIEEEKEKSEPEKKPEVRPPPPEKPEPGDCCGSGCVRCVWDIYYDELDEYNKLYKTDS